MFTICTSTERLRKERNQEMVCRFKTPAGCIAIIYLSRLARRGVLQKQPNPPRQSNQGQQDLR